MEVWKTKTLIHNLRKHFADEFVARVTSFKSCLIQCDFHCINYVLLCVTDSLQAFQCVPQFNSEILTHLSHARFNMSRLWRQNCTAIYGIILLSKDMTSVLFWGFLYIFFFFSLFFLNYNTWDYFLVHPIRALSFITRNRGFFMSGSDMKLTKTLVQLMHLPQQRRQML